MSFGLFGHHGSGDQYYGGTTGNQWLNSPERHQGAGVKHFAPLSRDIISFTQYCEILSALGDLKLWEGTIKFIRVKITREGHPFGGTSLVKYQLKGKRAPVFDMASTVTEALEHCAALIKEQLVN